MDTELHSVGINSKNGAAYSSNEPEKASNGDSLANNHPEAAEIDGLLHNQVYSGNGGTRPSSNAAEAQRILGNINTPPKESAVCRIKTELNEVIFWKIKLWMIIIFLFLLIIAVVFGSLALCAAIHQDEDEKFDPSLFTVPHRFNGSFEMPNLFIANNFTLEFNDSQTLTEELQQKLDDLYSSSSALGRYFSQAEIYAVNGSETIDYKLTFLLPEDEQEQLRKFVVSRDMVYNVFRQLLYDQEADQSEQTYIDPLSLTVFSNL